MEHNQEPKPQSHQETTVATGKSNQHQKRRRQRKTDPNSKSQREIKYIDPRFRFNKTTVEELFFKKLDTDFLKDLNTYFSIGSNKGNAVNEIKHFFSREENLSDAAKHAHSILGDFTFNCPHPRVPSLVVHTFLGLMIQKKNKISKLLDEKAGDRLLDKIPLQYLVDIVELYDLKLSKKDASIFFKELANSRSFTEIPRFLKLTGHEFTQELVPVIQRLIDKKQYKKLRMIPNLKKLFKQNKVLAGEKGKMINNVAFYQFRSEGWEYLEEIFEFHPSVIAQIISNSFGSRPSKFQKNQKYFQGVVSICERNPAVFQKLRPDAQKVIKQKREQMIKENRPFPNNFLRVDEFEPSSKDHFSFEQFQITQNHVHWVDDKVDNQKLKQIKETLLKSDKIAIDTESTLVRTPIDQDYDVLSLIQVSTEEDIYLVDPYNAKHPMIKAIFKEYFGNKSKTVIGHTIQDDVGTVADFFELGRPVCKVIDIKKEYESLKSNKQVGLKSISKDILGKEICKKYTMTNWDRRPLHLCQIHYAAMDAYIILKIWDKLKPMVEEKKKNPDPTSNKKQERQKKKPRQFFKDAKEKSEKRLPEENAKEEQTKEAEVQN